MEKKTKDFSAFDANFATDAATQAFTQWMDLSLKAASAGPEFMRLMMSGAPYSGGPLAGQSGLPTSAMAGNMIDVAVRTQRALMNAAMESWRFGAAWRNMEWNPSAFGLTGYFKTMGPDAFAPTTPEPAAAPKQADVVAEPPAPEPKPEAKSATKTARKANGKDVIDALLKEPSGDPDDLTKIKGIGPKLCEALHEMGIFHFAQIANLTEAEIEHINERLRFKGRIERERWVEQAKDLI